MPHLGQPKNLAATPGRSPIAAAWTSRRMIAILPPSGSPRHDRDREGAEWRASRSAELRSTGRSRGRGRRSCSCMAATMSRRTRPFLDRLARRWRVIAPRHPGFGAIPSGPTGFARSTTSPISISTGSTGSPLERGRPGRLVVRRLDRARDGGALGRAARAAGADRLARASNSAGARSATSPTSMRCPAEEVVAPHLRRSGAGAARLRRARRRRARRRSRATARRRRSTAGGPSCTTRPAPLAAPGAARRAWWCGAKRTASSPRPTARSSAPRCRTPASSRSPAPATIRRSSSPDAVADAIERFAGEEAER